MSAVSAAAAAVGVLALYLLIGLTRHFELLFVSLNAEDAVWISGDMIGSGVRLTSRFLLNDLGLSIFGEQLMGYRLLCVEIHDLNAYLLFWVYLLTAPSSAAPVGARKMAVRGGALLAGLLFLLTQMYALQWLAALAYPLMVLFSLLSIVMAQLHFRTGWWWPWILSAVAYCLALNSHSFALLLPLMIVLVERADASARRAPFNPLLAVARYSLHALGLCWFVMINFTTLFDAGEAGITAAGFWSTLARRSVDIVQARLNTGFTAPYLGLDIEYHFPIWPPVVLLVMLYMFGLFQLHGKLRRPGLAGMLTLFVLTMGLITLPMELVAPVPGAHWRSYPLAAMVALVLALGITRVLEGLCRLSPVAPGRVLRLLFLMAGVGAVAVNGHVILDNLSRIVSPLTRWQQEGDWNPPASCGELRRLTRVQAEEELAASRSLRCVDLSNQDLTGLDLAGADLSGARLTGTRLSGANLGGASLDGVCLFLAQLEGANLSGASIRNADLRGALLVGADLRQARLTGSSLHWTRMSRGDLRGAHMDRSLMVETRFEEADLRGVDFSRAKIISYNLDHARLDGARFPRWIGRWPHGSEP